MTDNLGTNEFANQSNCSESYNDYLNRAVNACEAGDLVLGMHLYLAAYERAVADPDIADGMALAGLREAWNLACDLKERSMAEYVFEKLEPFLTGEEIAHCANKLQSLALDRLEEYGFSREELQDMAEMISQDLIDGEGSIVKVESISLPRVAASVNAGGEGDAGLSDVPAQGEDGPLDQAGDSFEASADGGKSGNPRELGLGVASVDFNPYDEFNTSSVGTSYHAATNDGTGSYVFTRDDDRAAESAKAKEQAVEPTPASDDADEKPEAAQSASEQPAEPEQRQIVPPPGVPMHSSGARSVQKAENDDMPSMPEVEQANPSALNYRTLSGYGEAVAAMRDFGIGLHRDPGFLNFVSMMNSRHGLDRMPTVDTLLFRSPVIEDATRFVDATAGELGLPVLRMSMEEGFQGAPMLCVTTSADSRPRMNHAHNRFDGPGILIIDDLDMWTMPQVPEGVDGIAGFVMANMSRGAREAVNLIRSAVEDPNVYVLATATTTGEVESFFYDLLEPISIIDIAFPTDGERDEIWGEIMRNHPSMRKLDRAALTRLSAGLPRYDMYMAARAAVEEAYKEGLVERMYVPVTPQNIFDKLAACQPLDSDEYRAIEDEVVRSFRDDLDHLEDLLEGSGE